MAFEVMDPVEPPRSLTVHSFNAQEMLSKVSADIEMAPHLIVDSPEMLAEAQEVAGRLATVVKAIEAERKAKKEPVLEIARWLDDGYGKARDHLSNLIEGIKPKILQYQAQLRREAEERAERERAERERIAAEAAAAEAAAMAAATAALEGAAKARDAGSEIVAQTMAEAAVVAVDEARERAQQAASRAAAPVYQAAPKVKGTRTSWKGRVTNKAEAVAHIGAMVAKGDTSLLHLLEIDGSTLNRQANLQRESFSVPGLLAYPDDSLAIRAVAL